MNTIERIVGILAGAGYKQLPKSFAVSSLPFEFAAAFIGKEKTLDLILVVDLFVEKDESRLVQKIQALGRALDLVESRRSLTAVLVGTGLDPASLEAISRVCRVLAVGSPPENDAIEQYLHDWLAVLLPLPVLDAVTALADWNAELKRQVGKASNTAFFSTVVEAAHQGAESVETAFSARLKREVAKALQERSK